MLLQKAAFETALLAISFRPFCSSDHDERPQLLAAYCDLGEDRYSAKENMAQDKQR
jgi:hypothetical protein